MPYRREHNCTLNEEITEQLEVISKDTSIGIMKFVRGYTPAGQPGLRALRIPSNIPVNEGMRICNTMGGQFHPATPINPKAQLLTEKPCVSCIYTLVEEFEMPFNEVMPEVGLPSSDACYLMGHRELPYKNPDGTINRSFIEISLSRLNTINASSEIKLTALRKLLRLCKGYGIKVEAQPHFRLEDLDFYLTILTEVEREEEDADSKSV